ncbi:MAG: hypothetical protein QOG71_2389 [Pyrinomonadaceae bacterium]|nr:hypothetical protein [Pyrinomonadaceae bacterium]
MPALARFSVFNIHAILLAPARRMRASLFCLLMLFIAAAVGLRGEKAASATRPAQPAAPVATAAFVREAYGTLPLSFEANVGQVAPPVKFISRGSGYTLFLTGNEAVIALDRQSHASADRHTRPGVKALELEGNPARNVAVLRMKLEGANPRPRITGQDEQTGKANYLVGDDPEKWRTNVSTYAKVHYKEVYPGVDVVYYGNQRQLEYDFIVAPHANPARINFALSGGRGLRIDANGDLIMRVGDGEVRQHRPIIYQEIDGSRREVAGGYVLKGRNRVGFRVGSYDHTRPLIIDPVLSYSTYIGGGGSDYSEAVVVDANGSAYVSGYTTSVNFPTTAGAYVTINRGNYDAFVVKLNPAGTALVYATYLGGSSTELSFSLAVDASGQVHIAGQTSSDNFPTTPGAFQTTRGGGNNSDAFVSKLNASGSSLLYSTFIGGGDNDGASAIALDAAGNAYVTGDTGTNASGQDFQNFPTTPGAFQTQEGGRFSTDAFVSKLNSSGSSLVYSTLLGGNHYDVPYGIAVDASGNAFVTGYTESITFPVTAGAFRTTGGSTEAFVTKLNATGSGLVYSTLLGGAEEDRGQDIAIDAAGHAYVTGYTSSRAFPTTPGSFQPATGGEPGIGYDAFAAKLNPAGSGLVYGTYLGGSGGDLGLAIAADPAGNAYVAGLTGSTNFPLTNDAVSPNGGAFLTQLSPSGAGIHSTRFGSDGATRFSGVAVDGGGNAYATGYTNSINFPTTQGAFQRAYRGGESDSFVVKFSGFQSEQAPPTSNTIQFSVANFTSAEGDGRAMITVTRSGDISGQASVKYSTNDNQAAVRCDDATTMPDVAFARCDYATTVDTLNFAAGEAQKTFEVSLIDDAHVESSERVQLQLAEPLGGALGERSVATLTITDNDVAGQPNPIDDTPFFVRQQYLDFLSREPEPAGFDAWTGVLNRCSDVNNNPECDRIAVSAAFFRSQEFQLKGYYVYRFYKLSFGRLPLYQEIIADMRGITGATPEEVYAKRTLFSNQWVQRAAFVSQYDHLEISRFVDTLMDRYALSRITTPDAASPDGAAKVTYTRADLNDLLLSRRLTRAQVVRAIAESDEVSALEYNQAFVAMQYYGYLRRTPEPEGYQNWLRVINQDPNNVRLMVNGFMNSTEYRLRFGRAQ